MSQEPVRTARRIARRLLLSVIVVSTLVGGVGIAASAASPVWGA